MSSGKICFGALYNVMAKALNGKQAKSISALIKDDTPFSHIHIRPAGNFYLCRNGIDMAVVDTRTSEKMHSIAALPGVSFEAVLQHSVLLKRKRNTLNSTAIFDITVNVFGQMSKADEVSRCLVAVEAFLQHPKALMATIDYHNPQCLNLSSKSPTMNEFIGVTVQTAEDSNQRISEELGSIMESLTEVTGFEKRAKPQGLITNLKEHQLRGMYFIRQREDEGYCQELSARLHQDITPERNFQLQNNLGGLIADVMGLGKTLTVLAAVSDSRCQAQDFADFPDPYNSRGLARSRATLVVVSSAQVLESWVSETEKHFALGTLNYIRFHGQARPNEAKNLQSTDVVLTTYATLAADKTRRGLLYHIDWYRVVLDEAHWIRNSTSKQFKAAIGLRTRRRWCLTGTPIQNKIDDLTSIVQFLQIQPLSTKAYFERHVLAPLSKGGPGCTEPLRAYLKAHCLRRSADCLSLPNSSTVVMRLKPSSEERFLYNSILKDTKLQMDSLVSQKTIVKCNKLFTAILKMRRLCNAGCFSPTPKRSIEHTKERIDCELCSSGNRDDNMLLDDCSVCPDCGRPLMTTSSMLELPTTAISSGLSTPGTVSETSDMDVDKPEEGHMPSESTHKTTKLSAVVDNIIDSGLEAKSIVFSYWTSTLDILATLLEQKSVRFFQVDGRTSYVKRRSHLEQFKDDDTVRVLLMSIETGAVGLNLMVANKVHIVEPQWNPSVEEQAIGRAVRMGQTREVTILRYIMEGTVEENIINLQEKKKKLAKFVLSVDTRSNVSETLEDLTFVLGMDGIKS